MGLRQGKTKQLLESGIDCALLAVEIYNKPRTPFRVENYITNMIMAWTKVFHAHFQNTIGEKYFYKKKSSTRYEMIDGERKAWELATCIKKDSTLSASVIANLDFFIKLRNKIEHRHINKDEIGTIIFGECQALLNNFESFVIVSFGEEYALNESLAFALQFSTLRTSQQRKASKTLLAKEVMELKDFISKYRESLDDTTFNSQEFSIKLISVPKISNTSRNDLAVEFVNWNTVEDKDKDKYSKLLAIIKEKHVIKEVINPGRLKAGGVVDKVNADSKISDFTHFDHKCLCCIFSIRPFRNEKELDPFNTNSEYCHYDEAHDDYLYQEAWAEYIIDLINNQGWTKDQWKERFDNLEKIKIE
jgi:hypothetical protein